MPNGIREKLKRVLVVGEQRGTRFAFRGARLEEHDVLFNTERERSVKIVTLGFFWPRVQIGTLVLGTFRTFSTNPNKAHSCPSEPTVKSVESKSVAGSLS